MRIQYKETGKNTIVSKVVRKTDIKSGYKHKKRAISPFCFLNCGKNIQKQKGKNV